MFGTLARAAARFLRSDDGPTAVEYAIMLALMILVMFSVIGVIGSNANNSFTEPALAQVGQTP